MESPSPAPADSLDPSAAAAQLMAARKQYEANLKVMGTAGQMDRHVIDMLL